MVCPLTVVLNDDTVELSELTVLLRVLTVAEIVDTELYSAAMSIAYVLLLLVSVAMFACAVVKFELSVATVVDRSAREVLNASTSVSSVDKSDIKVVRSL